LPELRRDHGRRKDFFPGGALLDFFRETKEFSRGGENGEV